MKTFFKHIRSITFCIVIFALITSMGHSQTTSPDSSFLPNSRTPFKWSVTNQGDKLVVSVAIPKNHYLYADKKKTTVKLLTADGKEIAPVTSPEIEVHHDQFMGDTTVYQGKKVFSWVFVPDKRVGEKVTVRYMGCRNGGKFGNSLCFPPGSQEFELNKIARDKNKSKAAKTKPIGLPTPATATVPPAEESSPDNRLAELKLLLAKYKQGPKSSGYMGVSEFMTFLGSGTTGTDESLLSDKSIATIIILIILGGLALNLTPCVLPMIPINLAIIGAGIENGSRWQGLIRGSVYGLGIALAYGFLGLFVVLTGATFGALNSNPWFNLVIALIFIILGLAMFDLIMVDFSKYGSKLNTDKLQKGKLLTAFFMGIIAALLAGACVAPVVIAVLFHSTTIYTGGNPLGLILPFLLGFGMAIPWPFAGAGLSFLPKPGKWMIWIKKGFGILIFLFAFYYGYLGTKLLLPAKQVSATAEIDKLLNGMRNGLDSGKPVFIDFWASWCKSCIQMNETTFNDSKVKEKLHGFIEIRFQAEKPNAPETRPVMDIFEVSGLPTYVILRPENK